MFIKRRKPSPARPSTFPESCSDYDVGSGFWMRQTEPTLMNKCANSATQNSDELFNFIQPGVKEESG